MRQPKYYVSLGNVNLHHVESFELSSERDIDDYDGVGAGKFNVPGSRKPREWTIGCQLLQDGTKLSGLNTWSASELFKEFDAWEGKSDAPVRMVKTDALYPAANVSALVWLKSYTKKETEDQGVYDVEIAVVEYVPVGIRTTGIPTISRPGKAPVPPKVTITKKNTVYKTTKTYTGSSATSGSAKTKATLKDLKTNKPVQNPVIVKENKVLGITVGPKSGSITGPMDTTYSTDTGLVLQNKAMQYSSRFNSGAFDTWTYNVKQAFNGIGTSIKNFFTGKW